MLWRIQEPALYIRPKSSRMIPSWRKAKSLSRGSALKDFRIHQSETDTISLKKVEKITVEKMRDRENQRFAESAHPEIKVTLVTPVFYVELWATEPVLCGSYIHHTGQAGAS